MRAQFLLVLVFLFPLVARAQEPLAYRLQYSAPGATQVHVVLSIPGGQAAPLIFVMPRTLPGGYSWRPYDAFVEHLAGVSATGEALAIQKAADGPRWSIGKPGERVAQIEYDVEVARMEREIFSAVDSSRVRPGYAGLLGYSVFGYADGQQDKGIRLTIEAPGDWPVFSTLAPRVPAESGSVSVNAPNYYALADSQIVMGPGFQLRRIDGRIPLFLAVYAEGEEDLDGEGQLAREALDRVAAYFGESPIPYYSVHIELLRPISDRHKYDFSQEHLDSGSFSLSTARAITKDSTSAKRDLNRFNYAHHMAHSWIPKRAYGAGYLPFLWEMPPIIETIWFNEGFGRYAAIAALAAALPPPEGEKYRREQLDGLGQILDRTPAFIRKMSTVEVSRVGSFLYSEDWRLGQNLFSRGALMAAEMDDRIRERTQGKKNLSDALRSVLAWTRQNQRGFRIEELPAILATGTGVDVHDILERWLQPLDR